MTQTAMFWDKVAQRYAASPIKDMKSYEYTLGRTRCYLKQSDRVLEIGCGTGATALLLAENAAHITGTDISAEMMRIAEEKAAAEGASNVTFQVSTAQAAAETARDFDVVMGHSILHLIEDLDAVLATLQREMKPGSLFISKTPCLAEPSIGVRRFAFRALIPVLQLIGKAPFVHFLSFKSLEEKLNSFGFEIVETSSKPAMARYIVARKQ